MTCSPVDGQSDILSNPVIVFARDGTNWVGTVMLDDAVLAMPEIGVELPLRDLYAGIELPPPETDD